MAAFYHHITTHLKWNKGYGTLSNIKNETKAIMQLHQNINNALLFVLLPFLKYFAIVFLLPTVSSKMDVQTHDITITNKEMDTQLALFT